MTSPANPAAAKKTKLRSPSALERVKGKVNALAAEAKINGVTVNKSQLARQLLPEVTAELEALRRTEIQQEEARAAERAARAVRTPLRTRHAFEPVAELPSAELDKRRIKREKRIQQEAAQEPARFVTNPHDALMAAHKATDNAQRALAARMLKGAAETLPAQDPLRLEMAAAMHKAKGAAHAAQIVKPLLDNEEHGDKAHALMAALQLAQGESRTAFNLLSKKERTALAPLAAAAQLSLGIRTGDDDQCDNAMARLDKARFSNRNDVLAVDLSAYPGMPEHVRLCAGTLKYANLLGETLVRSGRLQEAVAVYDTLSPTRPACADERKDFIRALKSSGNAYYQYGLANRKALGELSVPHAPTQGWSTRLERSALSEKADACLDRAFGQLFTAFTLDGTDKDLRKQIAQVGKLTGNPNQLEQLNQRVHRRQKEAKALDRAPDDTALLDRIAKLGNREELTLEEKRLWRDLHRNRQAALRIEQQHQKLLTKITTPREETDKPAHQPSALARQRRVHAAPRR